MSDGIPLKGDAIAFFMGAVHYIIVFCTTMK